jgi:hypothetical protein
MVNEHSGSADVMKASLSKSSDEENKKTPSLTNKNNNIRTRSPAQTTQRQIRLVKAVKLFTFINL